MKILILPKRVVEFFENNGFKTPDIIAKGTLPQNGGLTKGQVERGMIAVYKAVQDGKNIKPLNLARMAFAEGAKVRATRYAIAKDYISEQVERRKKAEWYLAIIVPISALIIVALCCAVFGEYYWPMLEGFLK
jgi:hypothetical protein